MNSEQMKEHALEAKRLELQYKDALPSDELLAAIREPKESMASFDSKEEFYECNGI